MPDLSSEYRPGGTLVQTVPGAGGPVANALPANSGGYGLDPQLLAQLIAYKAAQVKAQQAQMAAEPRYAASARSRDDHDEAFTQFMPDPTPRDETITRTVVDPNQSPWLKYTNPGARDNFVKERLLPNGRWEFEDLRPRGSSGGIHGGGTPSATDPFGPMTPSVAQQNAAEKAKAQGMSAHDTSAMALRRR
jgi:hypothetical protein